jgi:hypothetical protein
MDGCREYQQHLLNSPSSYRNFRDKPTRVLFFFFQTALHCLSGFYHLPGDHGACCPGFGEGIQLQGTLFFHAFAFAKIDVLFTSYQSSSGSSLPSYVLTTLRFYVLPWW